MEIIASYFKDLSPSMINQFGKLFELYRNWNKKINLISRKDIENLYIHHVLHSLSIAKVIQFIDNTKIVDIGTGGGFPGIPLAIIFPNVNFYLIDSTRKKINVVNNIIQEINLKNAIAIHNRIEDIKDKFDFAVGRAVTSVSKLISLVSNNFLTENRNSLKNGIIYLKGEEITNEVKHMNRNYKVFKISDIFNECYFKSKIIIHIEMT
ncbi:MAG: 16S rRNA (guanine(527)-N(7))-methyltransferase RsmG [Bacteroidales bacterium]|nr:16S rRNA (guanine(527)-N(7))-methyltransferase RsmG [Bacteroidales bacterium]